LTSHLLFYPAPSLQPSIFLLLLAHPLREGVQRNFDLVHEAAARLGRVPEMLSASDFAGGLDEQSVILYVAHLCSRLLEISKQDRAAAVITGAMRRLVWVRKYGEWWKGEEEEGGGGQQIPCTPRNFANPALLRSLSTNFLGFELICLLVFMPLASRTGHEQARSDAATVVQKHWRSHLARCLVARLRVQREEERRALEAEQRERAATAIQAAWRGRRARMAVLLERCLVRRAQLVQER
jgi:hypothetical protein